MRGIPNLLGQFLLIRWASPNKFGDPAYPNGAFGLLSDKLLVR